MIRISDKTILAIIHAKTIEPNLTNITLAKRFNVSETTVNNYTIHLRQGEKKSLSEIRDWVKSKFRDKRCDNCSNSISRSSRGLCKNCYLQRNNPEIRSTFDTNTHTVLNMVETCSSSPTLNHHWMLDNLNRGICKYCKRKKAFQPWEDFLGLGDSYKEEGWSA